MLWKETMIIVPIFIPTSSSNLDEPFIAGTKNLAERGILAATLFVSGFIAGMVFYTGSVLDNLGSKYFRDEPSRMLSTFLPQGDFLLSMISILAPLLVAIAITVIVAVSEKAFARILGWVTVVVMLTIIVMGFIPV